MINLTERKNIMETFENLIPELHKKHYFKEDNENSTISVYSSTIHGNHATVKLNHNTGQAIFIFKNTAVIPITVENDPIYNANQKIKATMIELEEFNQLSYAILGKLKTIAIRRPQHDKYRP